MPTKSNPGRINQQVPKSLKQALEIFSLACNLSMTAIVNTALEEYIEKNFEKLNISDHYKAQIREYLAQLKQDSNI